MNVEQHGTPRHHSGHWRGLAWFLASIAVVVDALNDEAVNFYSALGFTLLPDLGRTMFLLRDTLLRHLK